MGFGLSCVIGRAEGIPLSVTHRKPRTKTTFRRKPEASPRTQNQAIGAERTQQEAPQAVEEPAGAGESGKERGHPCSFLLFYSSYTNG
ncbi:Uncharacterised protein [Cytobacillus firmus]|nr:hypothetical protein [Cytobacillus firmus]MBG9554554.1 hypothetical protein [Cytobacillus firmus]MBG9576501.1 hypothetical protein [Cytobacillus firmus]MBG9605408.1 hypothetical protein [Cytobacillus firmus]SUV06708.1 Uncharacterised protein [Cytobacillus firmus]